MKKTIYAILALCVIAAFVYTQKTSHKASSPILTASQEAPVAPPETAVPAAPEEAAAPALSEPMPGEVTLKGDIIDNMCATAQKPEDLANFVATHTKECALMPQCAANGYSIYADGQLTKFDKDSNAKIEEFLKQEGSKLQVEVVATKVGDELSLVSITNQQ